MIKFQWVPGRQRSGYEKLCIFSNPLGIPCDCYLLRFPSGADIPLHTDPVADRKHYRLNIVIKQAEEGGEFICKNPIWETNRIKLFRPDISAHAVREIKRGTRYVLSFGWTRS